MIQLFLNNHRIQISSDQQIKLSRENPTITSSGDYTFDVVCPLSIYDNKIFFGAWERIDFSKEIEPYSAKLLVNNKCVLNGSAKVTAINNNCVNIQLYGDKSEFNAIFGDKFIDELNLPYFHRSNGNHGFGGNRNKIKTEEGYKPLEENLKIDVSIQGIDTFIFPSIFNESTEEIVNMYSSVRKKDGSTYTYTGYGRREAQFNLLYIIRCVFAAIGYNADLSEYECTPYNHIFVASCISSAEMRHVLPHWTLKEFVIQLQNLFNCVFLFSSSSMEVAMVKMNSNKASDKVTLRNENVFSMDVDEDESSESRNAKSLHYAMSSSEYHDTDYFEEEKFLHLPIKEYPSYSKLLEGYEGMTMYDKGMYLLRCPEGDYCEWIYQGVKDPDAKIQKLIHINQFGDLDKSEDGDAVDLKICPVAIAESIAVPLFSEAGGETHGHSDNRIVKLDVCCYQSMPSMPGREIAAGGTFYGGKKEKEIILDTTDIQNLIMSDGTSAGYQKPDRMEIFFFDEEYQQATEFEFSGRTVTVNAPAVFTAYDHKDIKHINHKKWSMTLKKDLNDVLTMGELHDGRNIVKGQTYQISFIADDIPSASDIFIINNKRFFAEKIEICISNGDVDPLITGYFIEMS